jgi:hypothetical protein
MHLRAQQNVTFVLFDSAVLVDLDDALDKAGIKSVFIEFPKTAHEWQTWRKSLYDFAPRLFK